MKFDRLIPVKEFKYYKPEIEKIMRACLKKGTLIHVLFEEPKKLRSTGKNSQNSHLNGHIQEISMATGQPFDSVKSYIKTQAIDMGYPIMKKYGSGVKDFYGNPIGISESDATVEECSMLIECAHRLAAEMNIILREEEIDD